VSSKGDKKGHATLPPYEPLQLPHCWICKQKWFFNSLPSASEGASVSVRGLVVLHMQNVGFSRNRPFGSRGICRTVNCGGQG